MDTIELIDKVKDLAYTGKEYEEIEAEIETYSTYSSQESIREARRKIDDYIVNYQLAMQEKSKALTHMIIGGIILMIGLAITLGTYFGSYSQHVIAFGAILVGGWILKEGYKKYKLPIEELLPRKKIFTRTIKKK